MRESQHGSGGKNSLLLRVLVLRLLQCVHHHGTGGANTLKDAKFLKLYDKDKSYNHHHHGTSALTGLLVGEAGYPLLVLAPALVTCQPNQNLQEVVSFSENTWLLVAFRDLGSQLLKQPTRTFMFLLLIRLCSLSLDSTIVV